MKTYKIFLFILLQSFVSVVFSQEIRSGYKIFTEIFSVTFPEKQITSFKDVKGDNYKGRPKNKDGKELWNPSSEFSSKEKLKRIECEVYSEEERNYMLTHYKPSATVKIRASDGKIVSVTFTFVNLPDSSVINTKKLREFQEKIMDETYFENIIFSGGEPTSGYFVGYLWFFRP